MPSAHCRFLSSILTCFVAWNDLWLPHTLRVFYPKLFTCSFPVCHVPRSGDVWQGGTYLWFFSTKNMAPLCCSYTLIDSHKNPRWLSSLGNARNTITKVPYVFDLEISHSLIFAPHYIYSAFDCPRLKHFYSFLFWTSVVSDKNFENSCRPYRNFYRGLSATGRISHLFDLEICRLRQKFWKFMPSISQFLSWAVSNGKNITLVWFGNLSFTTKILKIHAVHIAIFIVGCQQREEYHTCLIWKSVVYDKNFENSCRPYRNFYRGLSATGKIPHLFDLEICRLRQKFWKFMPSISQFLSRAVSNGKNTTLVWFGNLSFTTKILKIHAVHIAIFIVGCQQREEYHTCLIWKSVVYDKNFENSCRPYRNFYRGLSATGRISHLFDLEICRLRQKFWKFMPSISQFLSWAVSNGKNITLVWFGNLSFTTKILKIHAVHIAIFIVGCQQREEYHTCLIWKSVVYDKNFENSCRPYRNFYRGLSATGRISHLFDLEICRLRQKFWKFMPSISQFLSRAVSNGKNTTLVWFGNLSFTTKILKIHAVHIAIFIAGCQQREKYHTCLIWKSVVYDKNFENSCRPYRNFYRGLSATGRISHLFDLEICRLRQKFWKFMPSISQFLSWAVSNGKNITLVWFGNLSFTTKILKIHAVHIAIFIVGCQQREEYHTCLIWKSVVYDKNFENSCRPYRNFYRGLSATGRISHLFDLEICRLRQKFWKFMPSISQFLSWAVSNGKNITLVWFGNLSFTTKILKIHAVHIAIFIVGCQQREEYHTCLIWKSVVYDKNFENSCRPYRNFYRGLSATGRISHLFDLEICRLRQKFWKFMPSISQFLSWAVSNGKNITLVWFGNLSFTTKILKIHAVHIAIFIVGCQQREEYHTCLIWKSVVYDKNFENSCRPYRNFYRGLSATGRISHLFDLEICRLRQKFWKFMPSISQFLSWAVSNGKNITLVWFGNLSFTTKILKIHAVHIAIFIVGCQQREEYHTCLIWKSVVYDKNFENSCRPYRNFYRGLSATGRIPHLFDLEICRLRQKFWKFMPSISQFLSWAVSNGKNITLVWFGNLSFTTKILKIHAVHIAIFIVGCQQREEYHTCLIWKSVVYDKNFENSCRPYRNFYRGLSATGRISHLFDLEICRLRQKFWKFMPSISQFLSWAVSNGKNITLVWFGNLSFTTKILKIHAVHIAIFIVGCQQREEYHTCLIWKSVVYDKNFENSCRPYRNFYRGLSATGRISHLFDLEICRLRQKFWKFMPSISQFLSWAVSNGKNITLVWFGNLSFTTKILKIHAVHIAIFIVGCQQREEYHTCLIWKSVVYDKNFENSCRPYRNFYRGLSATGRISHLFDFEICRLRQKFWKFMPPISQFLSWTVSNWKNITLVWSGNLSFSIKILTLFSVHIAIFVVDCLQLEKYHTCLVWKSVVFDKNFDILWRTLAIFVVDCLQLEEITLLWFGNLAFLIKILTFYAVHVHDF